MSYRITTKKYDEEQVEKIKKLLENSIKIGKPRYYEIFVDNLKVVSKTTDVSLFDRYKGYLIDDTAVIKILLYSSSATSPRNDKFLFTVKDMPPTLTLSQEEIKQQIDKGVNAVLEKRRIARMEEEIVSLKEELTEADETIEQITEQFELLKIQKRDESKEIKFGNVLSIAIEQVLKKNPTILNRIPIISTLSGLFSDSSFGNNVKQLGETKLENQTTTVLPKLTGFEEILFSNFNEAEIMQLIDILNAFIKDKAKIKMVFDLVTTDK